MNPIIDRLNKWVPCLLWLAFTAGCAVQPVVVRDGKLAWERYQESYHAWSVAPRYWQATGIMDIESPATGGRRHRVALMGQGWERGRMVVQGPFQQVAGELWMDEKSIRMIDPQHREVHQVPTSEAGLQRLAHVRLSPVRLLQVVLGVAAPPDASHREEGDAWISADGEAIQLDALGRMVERTGKTDADLPYQAVYEWGAAKGIMPVKVQLTIGDDHRIEFEWKEWRFPKESEGEEMLHFTFPEGFHWVLALE